MILITRPQLEAEELKAKLLENKIHAHCNPLISFHYHEEWAKKNGYRDNDNLHAKNSRKFIDDAQR